MDVEANVGDADLAKPPAQKLAMAAVLNDEHVSSSVSSEVVIKEGTVEKKGHSAAFLMWPR